MSQHQRVATHHRSRRSGLLALLAAAGLAVAACSDSKSESEKPAPASLEEVAEGEIGRITLTDQAADRLDIQTQTVEAGTGAASLQVPFDAVIYQADGSTWVYSNTEGLVFLRTPIEIDHIEGDVALLASGPEAGTKVVTVGASELLGFESGIGK
jgi:hypothetical protein